MIAWADSKDPQRRLRQFQTAAPTEYELLGVIPGSQRLEHQIHKRFEDLRVKGEWFFGARPLRAFIELEVLLRCDFGDW